MTEPSTENIENISLRQILSAVTVKQFWSVLGALTAIVIAAFSVGQFTSASKLVKTEAELHKIIQEQQAQMARLQFFERSFEYYRTLEAWQKSIGQSPPTGWSAKYLCNEEALSLVRSLEALRSTVKRLRDYDVKSGIGVTDPRGIQLSKAGGDLQIRFSATGDIWTVPDHFYTLNPDSSYSPGPCNR